MGTTDHDPEAFAEELAALKARGCALLVVGPPRERARCEDLLGEDECERERIVVDTGEQPADPGDDRTVIDGGATEVRSASAATPSVAPGPDTSRLDAIAAELGDHIDRLDARGLEPGELRVCLGDVGTLAAHEEGAIEAFLETVTARVREVDGMAHCHLPVTSPIRGDVEPTVDITVEVKSTPEGRQQRWVLHESELDSGWLAVEDHGDA